MQKKYVANKAFLVNPLGKILLLRLNLGKNQWDLPGGRMEQNEHPLEGLRREIEEETGIVIDPKNARLCCMDLWGVGGDLINEPVIGLFYIVPIGDVEVKISTEHNEILWFDAHRPLPENCAPFVVRSIEDYRKHEGIVTASDEAVKGHEGFGLIQLLTGNGKGKTTASLGEALRAKAIGKKVGIVFFDKGGDTHYSERKMLDQIGIDYVATGRDRIDPVTGRFDFSIQEIDKTEAERGLREVARMFSEGFDVVVMDEINSTTALKMIEESRVLELLAQKPEQTELILTGRNAPESFIKKAHLVTEMRLHKHYFYSGVSAREGLDY